MKRRLFVLLILTAMVSLIHGFDQNRKGFLLGFGGGISYTNYEQEISGDGFSLNSDTETEIGFATDFKIGYAPNNYIELYYSNQVAWFSIENALEDDVTIANTVGTLSVSYFTAQQLRNSNSWYPSPYISAGIGVSSWDAPFEDDDTDPSTGAGIFLGAGYEFKKHLRVSLNFFANNPELKEDGLTLTTKTNSLILTFSAMAF